MAKRILISKRLENPQELLAAGVHQYEPTATGAAERQGPRCPVEPSVQQLTGPFHLARLRLLRLLAGDARWPGLQGAVVSAHERSAQAELGDAVL